VEEPLPAADASTSTSTNKVAAGAGADTSTSTSTITSKAAADASTNKVAVAVAAAADTTFMEEFKQTSEFTAPTKLTFSNNDIVVDTKGDTSIINAPKDEKNLEALEKSRAELEEDTDDEDNERLKIGDNVTLDITDINDLNRAAASKIDLAPPTLDFEILT
jgi:hypothetical protein